MIACELDVACLSRIGATIFTMNSLRYFPVAGGLFCLVWWWRRDFFLPWRIQARFPKAERIFYELKHSLGTILIFTVIGVTTVAMGRSGWNAMYFDIGEYGIAYLLLSFVLLHAWQETWFYWMHRAVHRKRWFRLVHLTHHKSTSPSPFAAYGFHPLEAVLEGIYPTLLAFVLPLHPVVVIAQIQFTMILNIWWHSGYEVFPSGWTRGRVTSWINTATHHDMHHMYVNGNYSLYFNFWDRWMGTNFANYHEYFESVVARRERLRAERTRAEVAVPRGA